MQARLRVLLVTGAGAAAAAFSSAAIAAPADVLRTQNFWGGRYTTSTGESVRVIASDSFPVDETVTQAWADYLASLVHGPELARVSLYLAPSTEVQAVCGADALACYSAARELIVAPRDNAPGAPTAQAIVAHEYGHHIARNRANPPWDTLRYGTKRWASRIGVCSRTAAGTLYPGGGGFRYRLDPGEGFAESYRVLNEVRAGQPESAWQIVDTSLHPDSLALAALEQDVLSPWTGPTTIAQSGSFRIRGRPLASIPLRTPLDGKIVVRLTAPAKLQLRLSLYDTARREVVATGGRKLETIICGQRSLVVRVTRQAPAAGRFSLSVSAP